MGSDLWLLRSFCVSRPRSLQWWSRREWSVGGENGSHRQVHNIGAGSVNGCSERTMHTGTPSLVKIGRPGQETHQLVTYIATVHNTCLEEARCQGHTDLHKLTCSPYDMWMTWHCSLIISHVTRRICYLRWHHSDQWWSIASEHCNHCTSTLFKREHWVLLYVRSLGAFNTLESFEFVCCS